MIGFPGDHFALISSSEIFFETLNIYDFGMIQMFSFCGFDVNESVFSLGF